MNMNKNKKKTQTVAGDDVQGCSIVERKDDCNFKDQKNEKNMINDTKNQNNIAENKNVAENQKNEERNLKKSSEKIGTEKPYHYFVRIKLSNHVNGE